MHVQGGVRLRCGIAAFADDDEQYEGPLTPVYRSLQTDSLGSTLTDHRVLWQFVEHPVSGFDHPVRLGSYRSRCQSRLIPAKGS